MKTIPHHPDDLTAARDSIMAVLDDQFGDSEVTARRLAWLDTDEGKNHRHILGLWDANEDEDYYDELAQRSPELMARYLDGERTELGSLADLSEVKARAAYMYGFDLFDDMVEAMYAELGATRPEQVE